MNPFSWDKPIFIKLTHFLKMNRISENYYFLKMTFFFLKMNPFAENEPIFGGRDSSRLGMGVRGAKPPACENVAGLCPSTASR